MSMEFGPDQMKQLVDLLKEPEEPPVQDLPSAGYNTKTFTTEKSINKQKENVKKTLGGPKTIEEFEEQQENELVGSCLDTRKEPVYEMSYRQAVTAEDIFLQMGLKTCSTASCENLVMTIQLPGETSQHMDLSVTKNQILLEGKAHRLKLPLPQPIDPDRSRACWDSDKEVMTLTLKMDREFDFVNF